MEVEKLSDQDLQVLVEKLASDVEGRREQMRSLREQVREMQDMIQRRQLERTGYVKQLFQAEGVLPLVEQCLQMRHNLERKQKESAEAITSSSRDIKQLEQQVSESDLVDMEIESKENMISIAELRATHDNQMKENQKLNVKLARLQGRATELSKNGEKTGKKGIDDKLDRFIIKTCMKAGLELKNEKLS